MLAETGLEVRHGSAMSEENSKKSTRFESIRHLISEYRWLPNAYNKFLYWGCFRWLFTKKERTN